MRFLIPWSTDRLSTQYTDPVAQVCQNPILQGGNPVGISVLLGRKMAFTRVSKNHFPPGRTENLVGLRSLRPRIPHPCCSPFFFEVMCPLGVGMCHTAEYCFFCCGVKRDRQKQKKKKAKKITSASINTSGVLVRSEFKTVL